MIFTILRRKYLDEWNQSVLITVRFIIGMFFACLSMFTSGIIEIVRQQRCQGGKENSHCYFRIYIEIFKRISILIYRYILNWHRIYLWLVWIICHGGYLWICVLCISTFSEIAFHESSFFFDRYILIYQLFLYPFLSINQNRLELYCEYYELNIFLRSFFLV